MKSSLLCGIVLICAATAAAQTGSPAPPPPQNPVTAGSADTITMTGCISGGGSTAQPFTIASPTIVPPTAQPGGVTTATAVPSPTATPATPAATTGTAGVTGASPTGTTGTTGTVAATPPVSGATAAPASPATTPAPSAAIPTPSPTTAPAGAATAPGGAATAGGASTSGINGYRLTGTDMNSWAGRRVQIVGTVVPSAAATGSATPGAAVGSNSMQEFRVQSVQPTTGSCPQQ